MRTHIEHFIGSNPLLASTSCTDPVNNLKCSSNQTNKKSPKIIVLNLTENKEQIKIRSRSPSPFWIKSHTSTYSEVVKTGCVSRNNSRSTSPEFRQTEGGHNSRNSTLQTPKTKTRSKSAKDKWEQIDYEKNSALASSPTLHQKTPKKELIETLDVFDTKSKKQTKRRSRSRRSRSSKGNSKSESVSADTLSTKTPENISKDQNVKESSFKPENNMSDEKIHQNNSENVIIQSAQSSIKIVETCAQTDDQPIDNSNIVFDQKLLNTSATIPLNTVDNFSKSRLSLSNVFDNKYSDSCFDLNEQLKGIFGSVDKKHYRHRVFNRPRSKSDTRDLNQLTQIFTNSNPNDQNTCRFERSAESVKNNSYRDSDRRSFHNIISPFGNTSTELSVRTDVEHGESVRLRIFDFLELCVVFRLYLFFYLILE